MADLANKPNARRVKCFARVASVMIIAGNLMLFVPKKLQFMQHCTLVYRFHMSFEIDSIRSMLKTEAI